MNIVLQKASLEDLNTAQNLGRFYAYELFRDCGFLEGGKIPENGLFEGRDLSRYWKEPNRYPFLIRVDDELAGFALINKIGSTPDVDWNMGEFFIISKYQGKGIGRYVAQEIFKQFPGCWEVMQIPENQGAVIFWEKVIS